MPVMVSRWHTELLGSRPHYRHGCLDRFLHDIAEGARLDLTPLTGDCGGLNGKQLSATEVQARPVT